MIFLKIARIDRVIKRAHDLKAPGKQPKSKSNGMYEALHILNFKNEDNAGRLYLVTI